MTQGETLEITCLVTAGKPHPTLKWYNKGKGSEEEGQYVTGETLSFTSVTRHNAGHYVCEADNGFGSGPTTKELNIDVHCEYISYKSEVENIQCFFQLLQLLNPWFQRYIQALEVRRNWCVQYMHHQLLWLHGAKMALR